MNKLNGDVILRSKKLALVEQTPWTFNNTLRQNITFNSDFEEDKYKQCLRMCALEHDIDVLPGRDLTEIGERGINLSGGQKARVSLCR